MHVFAEKPQEYTQFFLTPFRSFPLLFRKVFLFQLKVCKTYNFEKNFKILYLSPLLLMILSIIILPYYIHGENSYVLL